MSTPKESKMPSGKSDKSNVKRSNDNEQERERDLTRQKWCKASWYLKGTYGKIESEAIPRSWISKSRSIVKWPPSDMNFKSAIESCMAPTQSDTWTSYVLVSCTHSVNTLQEARQLETETSESENMSVDEEDFGNIVENDTTLGRGHRVVMKNTKLADFESDVTLETSEATVGEDESSRQDTSGTRVVSGEVGDTSRSAAELEMVAKKLSSIDHKGPENIKIKTLAMKKALVRNYQYKSLPVSPVQNDGNVKHLASVQVEDEERTTMVSDENNNQQNAHSPLIDLAALSPLNTEQVNPKRSMDISDVQMKTLLIKFAAESKLRHEEVMTRLQQIENKMNTVTKMAKMSNTTTSEDCGIGSLISAEEFGHSSGDELDIERQFCVELPVHTFDDFWKLEGELESSCTKRKALRELFRSVGGRTENDMVLKCISKVIQRPQLAQHFNCGGTTRAGTLLLEPTDKHNFMGTQCQKLLLRVLRKKSPQETECSLRSRASDVLKRSSGLKGGAAYKAKRIKLASALASPKSKPDAIQESGSSSENETPGHA